MLANLQKMKQCENKATSFFLLISPQNYLLKKLNKDLYKPIILNFSSQTSSNETQNTVMSKLVKRRKNMYGAPPGTFVVSHCNALGSKFNYGFNCLSLTALI